MIDANKGLNPLKNCVPFFGYEVFISELEHTFVPEPLTKISHGLGMAFPNADPAINLFGVNRDLLVGRGARARIAMNVDEFAIFHRVSDEIHASFRMCVSVARVFVPKRLDDRLYRRFLIDRCWAAKRFARDFVAIEIDEGIPAIPQQRLSKLIPHRMFGKRFVEILRVISQIIKDNPSAQFVSDHHLRMSIERSREKRRSRARRAGDDDRCRGLRDGGFVEHNTLKLGQLAQVFIDDFSLVNIAEKFHLPIIEYEGLIALTPHELQVMRG